MVRGHAGDPLQLSHPHEQCSGWPECPVLAGLARLVWGQCVGSLSSQDGPQALHMVSMSLISEIIFF